MGRGKLWETMGQWLVIDILGYKKTVVAGNNLDSRGGSCSTGLGKGKNNAIPNSLEHWSDYNKQIIQKQAHVAIIETQGSQIWSQN